MRLEDYLLENTETKKFTKGDVIFLSGTQADAAYSVISGSVEIFEKELEPPVMAVLEEGQIFGEMALLRFDEYTLSARAAEDTELHVITPELLNDLVKETHPLIKAILDMLLDRIHTVNKVLIDIDKANKV